MKDKSMATKRSKLVSFRLKPSDKQLLINLADKEDLRLSELLREILIRELKKKKRKQ